MQDYILKLINEKEELNNAYEKLYLEYQFKNCKFNAS